MASANGGGGSSSGVVSAATGTASEDRDDSRTSTDTLFDAGELGGLTTFIQMGEVAKKVCQGVGLSDVVRFGGVTATHVQDPRSADIKEAVLQASTEGGFRFFQWQAEAVSRIVHPQSRTIEITREGVTEKFLAPQSDIGMSALMDQPPGVGKTNMTMLGAILFAATRGDDMQKTIDINDAACKWSNRGGVLKQTKLDGRSTLGAGRRIFVFANTQLVTQWEKVANLSAELVKSMTYANVGEWDISVVTNRNRDKKVKFGTEVLGGNEIRVYICDTSIAKFLPTPLLEPKIYVSVAIFDESAAEENNALKVKLPVGVEIGRIIMISADLSSWKRWNPQRPTVFRQIFPGWREMYYREEGKQNNETTAALFASSVFSPPERPWVLEECAKPLANSVLFTASVKYTPSLIERVGGGVRADLGEEKGCDVFRQLFDVDIAGCSTVGDLGEAIQAKALQLEARVPQNPQIARKLVRLTRLRNTVSKMMEDTCCICMENMENVSIIQPCLHFVCTTCRPQIRSTRCPCCNGEMLVGVNLEAGPCKKQKIATEVPVPAQKVAVSTQAWVAGVNMGEVFVNNIEREATGSNRSIGAANALETVLKTIMTARSESEDRHDTLRVMVICPGVEVRDGMFDDLGFGVTRYRTKGTKGDHHMKKAFEREMEGFQKNDGACKLLFVQDASSLVGGNTEDNMTGLDIDGLDAVVSIGRGNSVQRLGRVCRYSRAKRSAKKHALYVELVGR